MALSYISDMFCPQTESRHFASQPGLLLGGSHYYSQRISTSVKKKLCSDSVVNPELSSTLEISQSFRNLTELTCSDGSIQERQSLS